MHYAKHPKSRRALALGLLLALLIPILAACGSQPTTPSAGEAAPTAASAPTAAAPEEPTAGSNTEPAAAPTSAPAANTGEPAGKVLRIHEITSPDVVDPQKSSFAGEITILTLNYEGLTRLDKDQKAVPAAAKEWKFNADGTQLTFTLQDNLTYSDGSPLTSENFRYAVERTCDPNTAGQYQSFLFEIVGCEQLATTAVTDTAGLEAARQELNKGVQAPDAKTLVLNLTRPAPYYPYIAGLWVFFPAKKELIEQGGENWWKDPTKQIGNGVFQMTQFSEDQIVTFKANDKYWGGHPKLDGIEIIYQKETAVAQEAYKAGQLDIANVDPSQIPQLKSDPVLSKELLIYSSAQSSAWGFNLKREPFQDPKVREAFAYAFDRQTYCDSIRNGDCVPALSWIPEGVGGAIKTDKYGYDPDKARQALAESTYGGPDKLPEVKLTYNSDDSAAQPRIEWIAGQLRDVLGINVTLDPVEGKTLSAMRKAPETFPQACIFCSNWSQDYPDPQNWLSGYWTCDGTQGRRISYCNKDFDDLITKADSELDSQKRIQLYEQASNMLVDEQPSPFVYHLANVWLVKPYVKGLQLTASDSSNGGWPGMWASHLTVDLVR